MKQYDPSFLRTLDVPKPSTQTTRMCGPGAAAEQELESCISRIRAMKSINNPVKGYILLMLTTGIRISELCNIKGSDISKQLNIRIKGLKGSKDRVIVPVYERIVFEQQRKSSEKIGDTFNRFYFYRLFRKIGLYKFYKSNEKASVTHYPRYLHMKALGSHLKDMQLLSQVIGHKNKDNSEDYVNKE